MKNIQLSGTQFWCACGMVRNYQYACRVNDENFKRIFESAYPDQPAEFFMALTSPDAIFDEINDKVRISFIPPIPEEDILRFNPGFSGKIFWYPIEKFEDPDIPQYTHIQKARCSGSRAVTEFLWDDSENHWELYIEGEE